MTHTGDRTAVLDGPPRKPRGRPIKTALDAVDREIIAALQLDGRISNTQLAGVIGVSEGTVRRRLARLLKRGIIRVAAIVDPERLGYRASAFVGLRAEPSKVMSVADELAGMPEAELVSLTAGAFDILVWVNLPNYDALAEFLRSIGAVPGVRRTETFVSLGARKRSLGVSA